MQREHTPVHLRHGRWLHVLGAVGGALCCPLPGLAQPSAAPSTQGAPAAVPTSAPTPRPWRAPEDTAATLPGRALRLGLFKLQYGLLDSLTLGTYTAPWGVALANLQLKWRYYAGERLTAGVELRLGRLDVTRLGAFEAHPGDAIIVTSSVEPSASYALSDALDVSATVPMSKIAVDGSVDTEALQGALGGALDNLQLTATLSWRVTSLVTLRLHGRYLLLQRVVATTENTYHPDPFTRVVIRAGAEASWLGLGDTWALVPAVALDWDHLHLRAGLGYGNWTLEPVNFVLPHKGLIPELDVSYVF